MTNKLTQIEQFLTGSGALLTKYNVPTSTGLVVTVYAHNYQQAVEQVAIIQEGRI